MDKKARLEEIRIIRDRNRKETNEVLEEYQILEKELREENEENAKNWVKSNVGKILYYGADIIQKSFLIMKNIMP